MPAMLAIGLWVSDRIVESASHMAGSNTALFMENFVEPLVQELATSDEVTPANVEKLSRLLKDTPLGQRVLTLKIWAQGGLVVASNRRELIGMRFEPNARLKRAWKGIVAVEYDSLKETENEFERRTRLPLLEVYVPLRARGTDQVIAVGEFYEHAHELKADLVRAKMLSWLVVAGVTLSMLAALFAIVRHGSRTIEEQQSALEQRIDELTRLLADNQRLRIRVNQATARATESNESYLRRLGADLHDGPAQLVSLALLQLAPNGAATNRIVDLAAPASEVKEQVADVRTVLRDALKDIRNIAGGLALPEIGPMSLSDAIALAVRRHEELTRTRVALRRGHLPKEVSQPLKLCAYRIVQEGLTNAFRHAGGTSQSVVVEERAGRLVVVVSDEGAGFAGGEDDRPLGLGLQGLTNRIESLGGIFQIDSAPGRGTRLTAWLPTKAEEALVAQV